MKLGLSPVSAVAAPDVPSDDEMTLARLEVVEASNELYSAFGEYERQVESLTELTAIKEDVETNGIDSLITTVGFGEHNMLTAGFEGKDKETILADINVTIEAQQNGLIALVVRIWKFLKKMMNKIIKMFMGTQKRFLFEATRVGKLKNPALVNDANIPILSVLIDEYNSITESITAQLVELKSGKFSGTVKGFDILMSTTPDDNVQITTTLSVDDVLDAGRLISIQLLLVKDWKKVIDSINPKNITTEGTVTLDLSNVVIPHLSNTITKRSLQLLSALQIVGVTLSNVDEATPSKEELEAERIAAELEASKAEGD